MSWRDIMTSGTFAPSPYTQNTQNTQKSPWSPPPANFENIEDIEYKGSPPRARAKTGTTIDELLIALTLAVHDTRIKPRPVTATGRRTSIEDGLAIARAMEVLDGFAKTAASRPELMTHARGLVDKAAGFIRQWNFYGAYQALDELKRLTA